MNEGEDMKQQLSMSAKSELAEARAVADRCRRLEAELRDRERDLDAAREQVTTLRAKLAESQKLVPLPGTVRKHPHCDCAKLPHRHDYDSRSCTGEADKG